MKKHEKTQMVSCGAVMRPLLHENIVNLGQKMFWAHHSPAIYIGRNLRFKILSLSSLEPQNLGRKLKTVKLSKVNLL